MIVYHFVVKSVNIICRILYRHRLYGKENALKGAAVIAPNHLSHLDPAIVGAFWPGKARFFARDTLFKGFMGWLLPRIQVYPIRLDGADIKTMRQIFKYLDEGEKIVIFPEGTRSPDGILQKPQAGFAMIAQRAGVPIIPVYVAGTFEIMPPGTKPKLSGRVSTTIGKAIDPTAYSHLPKKEAQQAIMEEWTQAIQDLIRSQSTTNTSKTAS